MDLVAWRGKAKGGQLRSFLDSTNRSAYRIKYKQGSLLTLLVAKERGRAFFVVIVGGSHEIYADRRNQMKVEGPDHSIH